MAPRGLIVDQHGTILVRSRPSFVCALVPSEVTDIDRTLAMLSGIHDLEFDRGNGAADNTDHGVATIIREENGGFSIEAGVLTVAPLDPARRNHTRTRMGDYAAVSMVRSSRSFIACEAKS